MRAPTLPLYVGAFLGPFGAGVLPVLVPQLRAAFDASTAVIALGIPAYLVPFAVLQLVSGTLGERYGRRRVVWLAYLTYAAGSAGADLARDVAGFLCARAVTGSANAFVTPLLLASLADATDHALGRAIGTFAAVQTAGLAMAPLVGGVLGELGWRVAFLAPAVAALGLALVPPADTGRTDDVVRWRSVLRMRVGLLSAAAFAAYAGTAGAIFLVALRAADEFGLGSSASGVVLAGFGVAGMVLGRAAGSAVDRFDPVPIVIVGALGSGAAVAAVGVAPSSASVAGLWTVAGAGSALIWAGLHTLAVEAVPANRAGGTSVVGAFKFTGSAVAPLMWLPLYHADGWLGFAGAGATTALVGAFVAPLLATRSPGRRLPAGTRDETA